MATLVDLKAFDIEGAHASIWAFKTSGGVPPRFTGHWIGITDELAAELKAAVSTNLDVITETLAYGLLVDNNEGSALTILAEEAHANLIAAQVLNETEIKRAKNVKHLANSAFYVAKFVANDRTLLAVRKTDTTWRTRKASGMIRAVYSGDRLDVERSPVFTIEPYFDFYVLDGQVFVRNKKQFETLLRYKAGHAQAFAALTAEPEFAAVFADTGPIIAYVGTNKMQLRRALSIQEKGHYKNGVYMRRLKERCASLNFEIDFDEQGRIVPTVESCAHIFKALLNHRLFSQLSEELLDVPSTMPIS